MTEPNNESFDARMAQIAEQVNAIGRFVGRTAELQMQTQIKLDAIAELDRQTHAKLDRMSDTLDRKLDRISDTLDQKLDRISDTLDQKLDQITANIADLTTSIREQGAIIREQNVAINGYHEIAREQARSTAELIKLVAILSNKAS